MATAEVAVSKRLTIRKTHNQMLMILCLSAAAMGVIIILSLFMLKTIIFNSKVLGAKDESIATYKANTAAIRTLNGNVMGLATDLNLESVALERDESCNTLEGQLADFADDVEMARKCSALRVIPDAMPWQANPEALGSSLNKLLEYPGVIKETDSVGNGSETMASGQMYTIDSTFSATGAPAAAKGVLERLESSIRPFSTRSAIFEWRANGALGLFVNSNSYYVGESQAVKKTKNVRMD